MEHTEAVQQMATEKYLLNELSQEQREAFEEHFFGCPECALDLQSAAAFIDEAKVQLPQLVANTPVAVPTPARPVTQNSIQPTSRKSWFSWIRPIFANPAFAAPAFATLLTVVSYQNLVTYPALRASADDPRVLPTVALHSATRSGTEAPIAIDPKRGLMLLIDAPQDEQGMPYSSLALELKDPAGKLTWSNQIPAAGTAALDDGILSLLIPGAHLKEGAYTLTVFGVTADGQRIEKQHHTLNLQLKN